VLAGTADGTLYALDAVTGEEKGRYEVRIDSGYAQQTPGSGNR